MKVQNMPFPKGCPWHGKVKHAFPEGILQRSPWDLWGGKTKHALGKGKHAFGKDKDGFGKGKHAPGKTKHAISPVKYGLSPVKYGRSPPKDTVYLLNMGFLSL